MADLSENEIQELKDAFDLVDFWSGGMDGVVKSDDIGKLLGYTGINPTSKMVKKAPETGKTRFKFEDFLPVFKAASKEEFGTIANFMEAFKTFDKEGQGLMPADELRHCLTTLGEPLEQSEVEEILKLTETREDVDGNIKYEEFIKKVMAEEQ